MPPPAVPLPSFGGHHDNDSVVENENREEGVCLSVFAMMPVGDDDGVIRSIIERLAFLCFLDEGIEIPEMGNDEDARMVRAPRSARSIWQLTSHVLCCCLTAFSFFLPPAREKLYTFSYNPRPPPQFCIPWDLGFMSNDISKWTISGHTQYHTETGIDAILYPFEAVFLPHGEQAGPNPAD
ncbi:hypothetical protein BJV82DRAFT_662492 [Fennellomyces sp. T-0311]|nr:hypothetical protein BJV82DRAFT_662492 [Fennellomyces sp. T-0311]